MTYLEKPYSKFESDTNKLQTERMIPAAIQFLQLKLLFKSFY